MEARLSVSADELCLRELEILVLDLAALFLIDLNSRELVLDTLEDGDIVGRSTAVITAHDLEVIDVRTYDSNLLHVLGKRKHAALVLEHHDTFLSHLECMVSVSLAVND